MYSFIFIQLLAILFLFFWTISYHFKKRSQIMFFQSVGLLLMVTHLFLLKAHVGAILTLVAAFRHFLFTKKRENHWISSPIILAAFIFIFILITSLTINAYFDLFALLGVILASLSGWQMNKKKLKIYSIFSILSWMIYHFFVRSYGGIISNIIMIASSIVSLKKREIFEREGLFETRSLFKEMKGGNE
jgi:drug/metabolite transporter (DMT)-like permease